MFHSYYGRPALGRCPAVRAGFNLQKKKFSGWLRVVHGVMVHERVMSGDLCHLFTSSTPCVLEQFLVARHPHTEEVKEVFSS